MPELGRCERNEMLFHFNFTKSVYFFSSRNLTFWRMGSNLLTDVCKKFANAILFLYTFFLNSRCYLSCPLVYLVSAFSEYQRRLSSLSHKRRLVVETTLWEKRGRRLLFHASFTQFTPPQLCPTPHPRPLPLSTHPPLIDSVDEWIA